MSTRLGQYDDIRLILDEALAAGGGTYTLATHSAAVHWRQRAYKFRKAYAEAINGASKYDKLEFPRLNPNTSEVIIRLRKVRGIFTPNVEPIDQEFDDPLEDFALNFAKKLEGE